MSDEGFREVELEITYECAMCGITGESTNFLCDVCQAIAESQKSDIQPRFPNQDFKQLYTN